MTLSSRILRAAYFPAGSFFEAKLGSHPSQIWRAILDGREALSHGIIRRIGTGEDTRIWEHNWIPRLGMMRPITSLIPNPPQYVSDLIESSSASWREDLVRSVFLPVDAEKILKIPVSTKRVADFWAWGEDSRGLFSVSSVYRMLVRIKINRENCLGHAGRQSDLITEQKSWTALWGIKVPSKIKNFLWRLCHESLPTGEPRTVGSTP